MSEFQKQDAGPHEITALLGAGTRFEGNLFFEGIVRIDGEFRGQIFSRDTLVLGQNSRVMADVDADVVIVGGKFEGNINATSRVDIQKTGSVSGSVKSPVFQIEEGGLFEGKTQMLGGEKKPSFG